MLTFSRDKRVRLDGATIGHYGTMGTNSDCWFFDAEYTRKIGAIFAKTKKELRESLKQHLISAELASV